MSNLLQADGLTFRYGDRVALRDVSLSLNSGEILALIGPNGSGKSTLLKCLTGFLHAQGHIRWFDQPIASWSRRALARKVAYLPQNPQHEPGQTVAEVLRLGRAPYWSAFGLEDPSDSQAVADIAAQLSLTDLLSRPLDELSGGQRQRVFIGRSLAQKPAALLLDEPSTFLDLKHQVDLCKLLRDLANGGLGILLASHDLNLAAAYADRMLLLSDATVAAVGSPSEVLDPATLSRVYTLPMRRLEPTGEKPIVFPKND